MLNWVHELQLLLQDILILPRRILLETPQVHATVPMLRGVWGAALHGLDRKVYAAVFDPVNSNGDQPPGYLLRPAPPDPHFAPAVEWFLLGNAIRYDSTLLRAWDIASGMGLGPSRQRFFFRSTLVLGPNGSPSSDRVPWPLSRAAWPLPGDPEHTTCRLVFPAPLRIRYRGRLVTRPQLPDIVAAALRRIGAFLPDEHRSSWKQIRQVAMQLAREIPCGAWHGERLDLHRYSARQKSEIDLFGVSGHFQLPEGPGPLWPLLLAASWLHVGKGTVMGLGQVQIEP